MILHKKKPRSSLAQVLSVYLIVLYLYYDYVTLFDTLSLVFINTK